MSEPQLIRRYNVVKGQAPKITPSKRFIEINGLLKKDGELIYREVLEAGKYIIKISTK